MRKQQAFRWDRLSLGTDYYPEHWDRSLWESDLTRMKAAGIGTVRVAEFAWSILEPKEGEFSFGFFDDFLDLAQAHGMKVIFSTPTATPPAWLTEKYPEVLNCRIDGVMYRHGMRRHYNYNSPKYRELTARIVEKEAEHFAKHPAIIGWQIDNEINCETDEFYSESDTAAFRTFLKEKYGSLDSLNRAWGTVFWSQTYSEWEEIHVPRLTVHLSPNPHMVLDYSRFISESAISFCGLQSEILRRYKKPGDFITTNGLFGRLDNHRLMDETLDVYTFDTYPNFAYGLGTDPKKPGSMNDRRWSAKLDEVRAVCPHFGIMEQQSGPGSWTTRMEGPSPKPGQLMLWAMQSIAHGADYVGFFRWRTAAFGTEMYWHGILDCDNRDNRRLAEVCRVRDRAEKIADVAGADYAARIALVRDYDNDFDRELDTRHGRLAWSSQEEIAAAALISHTPLDYVYFTQGTELSDLSHYELLIYPHPMIMTKERADLLKEYVRSGGTLILGARAGAKEITGQCVMEPIPGLLRELTGTEAEDFTLLGPADDPQFMTWDGEDVETGLFSDILCVTDPETKVLAAYGTDYYAGKPALTEKKCGKGRVLHFGGTFTRNNTLKMLRYTGQEEPLRDLVVLPQDCEVTLRIGEDFAYLFILNYAWDARTITLKKNVTDVDAEKEVQGEVVLSRFETKVYRFSPNKF